MKIPTRELPLVLPASLLLFALSPRPATAQLLGPEFQVNSYTTNSQYQAAVAADGTGHFVVVWQSVLQNGAGSGGTRGGGSPFQGVFGQRFNAAGSKLAGEFQVNSYTTGLQAYPAVAVDGLGGFDVVWSSSLQDGELDGVFGQRYDSSGGTLGSEFPVNSYTTSSQRDPAVAADGSGNFVVVWDSNGPDGSVFGIFGQRFDSTGAAVGSEFQINSYTTNSQTRPAVAATAAGSFVVVWMSSGGQDGSGDGVFGQRFSSAGAPLGSEFQVNSYTSGSQQTPAVAVDGSGKFVVVWSSSGGDGSYSGVFGQRYDAAGSAAGSNFQVNTYTTQNQYSAAVAANAAGEFLVTWGSSLQDGSSGGVFGQRFDAAGSRRGSELRVNSTTAGIQSGPAVATDGAGRFVVAWNSADQDGSGSGVFGQRLPASLFFGDFEKSPPFWSDTTAATCTGFCASAVSPDGICYCDNLCLIFGDCCLDACKTCGQC